MGLLFLLVCPTLFVAGLVVMPIGVWLARRRRAAGRPVRAFRWPSVDLNDAAQRKTAAACAGLTLLNVLIAALGAFRAQSWTRPIAAGSAWAGAWWAGYRRPHARVPACSAHRPAPHGSSKSSCPVCVKSRRRLQHHRGPSVTGHRPPPGADTCEQCHWPEKFRGDVVRTVRSSADDEANTGTVGVRLHIGHQPARNRHGIHWHVSAKNRVKRRDRRPASAHPLRAPR